MNGGMSAFGTKRTYRVALHMSAFGGKADIARMIVSFRPRHGMQWNCYPVRLDSESVGTFCGPRSPHIADARARKSTGLPRPLGGHGL